MIEGHRRWHTEDVAYLRLQRPLLASKPTPTRDGRSPRVSALVWIGVALGLACGARSVDEEGAEGETGGPSDVECARYYTQADCIEAGCGGMVTAGVFDDDCNFGSAVPFCAAKGGEARAARTWYRERLGRLHYFSTPSCEAGLVPEIPGEGIDWFAPGDGWTECSGGVDDPEGCACACVGGACPEVTARETQLACAAAEPCPELDYAQTGSSGFVTAAQCLIDALKARTPGHYVVLRDYGEPEWSNDFWITPAGETRWTFQQATFCPNCCPFVADMLEVQVVDDARLDACMASINAGDQIEQCNYTFSAFFNGWTPAEPACD